MEEHDMRLNAAVAGVLITLATSTVPVSAGLSWRVEYDEAGEITRSIDPAGRATQYLYVSSANGLLQSITQVPSQGAQVTWRFDDEGRIERRKVCMLAASESSRKGLEFPRDVRPHASPKGVGT